MRAASLLLLSVILLASCHPKDEETARQMTGGDPGRGKHLVGSYGCGACHEVPGVNGATGLVGLRLETSLTVQCSPASCRTPRTI
jgi:hypothetical protein